MYIYYALDACSTVNNKSKLSWRTEKTRNIKNNHIKNMFRNSEALGRRLYDLL
jgi:hypothetical protein